jgi:signal transduction histidine kinase/CheY-like chemotaxis protein
MREQSPVTSTARYQESENAAALSRAFTSIVYEALGQPLEESGDGVAAKLRALLGSEFCLLGRYEGGSLVCRGKSGDTDVRIESGGAVPLREHFTGGNAASFVELVGSGEPEPLGEYLRLIGFRYAVAVAIATETTTIGAVLLGYRDAQPPQRQDMPVLAAALQPLALAFRQSPLTAPETLQRQRLLEHSQKMEALGSMAGMIAHDFNNLLTTILGYTSILKNAGRLDPDDQDCIEQVEEAAHRAADLTARLLAFARGGVMRTGPLDLRAVLSDTIRLAEPALHNRVAISLELPEEPVAIEGDEGQLQQALLNVVLNARDAMPDGGHVLIGLQRHGQAAVVGISDNGPGMDPATRERIFDPFFTTKPMGSGTGLGMSITYSIVKAHGGHIDVESTPGEGTTFSLHFPALATMPVPDARTLMASGGDRDLVLVVDDDDMVRRTTMATLAHLGYNVVDAPSGRIALQLVEARPERFAVVLLDLVMPELTGGQTFKELQKIREDLPVVICTGYAADAHLDDDARQRIAGLIHKPFTPERLDETLVGLGVRKARAASS